MVLAFNLGVEAAGDALTLLSRPSTPGEPAPLHHYVVVNTPDPLTWDDARAAAKFLGAGCDLATITSEAEQAIINGLLPPPSVFAGTTQDYWIGGIQDNCDGGGDGLPGCHWRWINVEGEFWDNVSTGMYANWGSLLTCPTCDNEPNDSGGNENRLTVDSRYLWGWNDLPGGATNTEGYIAEGTEASCPLPID